LDHAPHIRRPRLCGSLVVGPCSSNPPCIRCIRYIRGGGAGLAVSHVGSWLINCANP
jgi:hypothetical protein